MRFRSLLFRLGYNLGRSFLLLPFLGMTAMFRDWDENWEAPMPPNLTAEGLEGWPEIADPEQEAPALTALMCADQTGSPVRPGRGSSILAQNCRASAERIDPAGENCPIF